MSFIEGIDELEGTDLLIKLFEFVQRIPYRVCPFDEVGICAEAVTIGLKKGDCRHKSLLLYNMLLEKNFDVERVKVIFDWKDLPIPAEILGILKSGTKGVHDVLRLNVSDKYFVYVDPTWNLELGGLGFPVTKMWDGKSPTEQVTRGRCEYFGLDEDCGVKVNEDEMREFGEVLNMWLDEECPIRG